MSELRAMLEKQWQSRTVVSAHKVASWVRPMWMQTADPGPQNGRCGWVLPEPPGGARSMSLRSNEPESTPYDAT